MNDATHITPELATARRLIIKIGSALLVDKEAGTVNTAWLASLAADIAQLRQGGCEVAIVSSGAIALGRRVLGLHAGELKLEESQAAAAAGQVHLAHAYEEALKPHDITIAQILLTLTDSEERRRYLNARSTLETLFRMNAMPIVNENDTVATSEIRYGDNDRLAARVAQMVSADTLVLLSDIDGLYTADPTIDNAARHVPAITAITPDVEAMAGKVTPRDAMRMGSGGMATKLKAARICMQAGCRMVIANGHVLNPVAAIDDPAHKQTWFLPEASPLAARKQWIAGSLKQKGVLVVDDGAAAALKRGKSLLPAGITHVEGQFERGDAVAVRTTTGQDLGRGLSAYSSEDARKILGHKSSAIEDLLGYKGRAAMIHVDDLVLTPHMQHDETT